MEKIKSLIYSFIDLLSFGKGIKRQIGGFSIYFPARWSRYFESHYESDNIAFLKKHLKPGDVVFDIGAHLGLMSVISSQLVGAKGKVYAFEPSPSTFRLLKKVIALNAGLAPILPQPIAVSNKKGRLSFFISVDMGSNSNSLVEKHHLERNAVEIDSNSLDGFIKEHSIPTISLLKIDAEGSELQVLQGAVELLKNHRPKVILAVHPRLIRNNGDTPREVFAFISSLGYKTYLQGRELNETDFCAIEDFFDVHLFPQVA